MSFSYPRNLRFVCVGCGICCGDTKEKTRHVLLLKEEANSIAALTGKRVSDFAVEVADRKPYVYEMKKSAEAGRCFFLGENRCTIYSDRPLICRFYPLGVETSQNIEVFYFTGECPGIGKGKFMRKGDFKKLRDLAETRGALASAE